LQKGDLATAESEHQQLLKLGTESNDQTIIALAHAERGSALVRQERFSEALDELTQAYTIYNSLGIQRSAGYNLLERARTLGGIGRFDEANSLLTQAMAIAEKGDFKRLNIESRVTSAEIALAQERFADAANRAKELLPTTNKEFPAAFANLTRVLGLALTLSGNTAAGKQQSGEAVELATQMNDSWQLARAQLALAEVRLRSGDWQGALDVSLQANEVFTRFGQQASAWRAMALAALAKEKLSDKTQAQEYAGRANEALSKLEQTWGKSNYDSFLARPDAVSLKKQLDQISAR
jgi:tetratricopeptide (TPR) repeat protein